jgi:hypothetical protein
MEIITALGFILVANSISSPAWWVIILEVLFVVFAVALGSVKVSNDLFLMRKNIKENKKK